MANTGLYGIAVNADEPLLAKKLPDSQRAFIDGAIELPAEKFFSAYTSKNIADRRYAEVYLLGALEATEGISWCSYRRFKTGTIAESIFEGFKKLNEIEKNKRAAKVIISILSRDFPCEGAGK